MTIVIADKNAYMDLSRQSFVELESRLLTLAARSGVNLLEYWTTSTSWFRYLPLAIDLVAEPSPKSIRARLIIAPTFI
jgi:hypothetical protein